MESSSCIGVLDSGLGGLSVMKEVISRLPFQDIFYFADTANLPLGERSKAEIVELTLKNARFLEKSGVGLIIVACHTASTRYPISLLQENLSIPVIGMVEPSVNSILKKSRKDSRLAILGTNATIDSKAYEARLRYLLPQAEIFPVRCPLLASSIETGNIQEIKELLDTYLSPIRSRVNQVFLGCTHYALIQKELALFLGPEVEIIDPAIQCGELVREKFLEMGKSSLKTPKYRFFATRDLDSFFTKVKKCFLNETGIYEKISVS